MNHYPLGTENLWMAYYRDNINSSSTTSVSIKISGTIEEACVVAQKFAIDNNLILQNIKRRF